MKVTEQVMLDQNGNPVVVKQVDVIGGVVDLGAAIAGTVCAVTFGPQIAKLVPVATTGLAKVGSVIATASAGVVIDYAVYKSITGVYEELREETEAVKRAVGSRSDEILQEVTGQQTAQNDSKTKK